MRYLVKTIQEADYGCEDRPADYVANVTVIMKDENGEEIHVEVPDKELYEKHIEESDWVYFDFEGVLHKED